MTRRRAVIGGAAAALLLGGAAVAVWLGVFPPDRETVQAYNDAIQAVNRKVEAAVGRFGRAIDRALHGSASEAAAARAEYAGACQDRQQALAEAKAIRVPWSSVARGLYAAHQAFLHNEEQVFRQDYEAIVRLLEDSGWQADKRQVRVEEAFAKVEEKSRAVMEALVEAHLAFARYFDLQRL
jgi:hypothetical protein